MSRPELRAIPSVDRVVRALRADDLPRPAVVAVARRELANARAEANGTAPDDVLARVGRALDDLRLSRIQPVINGTGIIIHTNFGRSPLGPNALAAITNAAANYTNLEFDLSTGQRGGRAAYLEHNLALLCVAERATVVNNCAAALVLVVRHFVTPDRPNVVVSRGELVQIGGGFRVPEILQASGATLREIGTTNKTTADDYARAIDDRTAMVLKVHRSNFYMGGFTESPATAELAAVATEHRVPLIEDLGSGATFDTATLGDAREHEPTPADVLRQGVDLVCFSGDKLFGGPQAGIIAGKSDHIAALKREPLVRALRCDKLVLAGLQATVDAYLGGTAADDLPSLAMMRLPIEQLRPRAERIAAALRAAGVQAGVTEGASQVGGGSLPRTTLPSSVVAVRPSIGSINDLAARLRRGAPPVVGYIADGQLKLDVRTIFPHQDDSTIAAVRAAAVST